MHLSVQLKFVSVNHFFSNVIEYRIQSRSISLVFHLITFTSSSHIFRDGFFPFHWLYICNLNEQHVFAWPLLVNSVVLLLCQQFMYCFTFTMLDLSCSWTTFIPCILEFHALNYLQLSCRHIEKKRKKNPVRFLFERQFPGTLLVLVGRYSYVVYTASPHATTL